ncbi:MAG: hypothetical protein JSR48_09895 [Verrucomicrobia bacterium]|nr:hypothetical protein [Verrucomicrobiota bacterium]
MSAETTPPVYPAASLLGELQQLYRRICVLRAKHQSAELQRLETEELPRAVAAVRAAGDEHRVPALFAAEDARVDEAHLLAELLAPLLAIPGGPASVTVAVSGAPSRPVAAGVRGPALSIADFIDGMIAQEQAARSHPSSASAATRPQPATPR